MKDIQFKGQSLNNISSFPATAKREAGYQLSKVQAGLEPSDWKPMNSIGTGVKEIRIKEGNQYRVIYLANKSDAIYVLHAFEKKTQRTSQRDLELARKALKEI